MSALEAMSDWTWEESQLEPWEVRWQQVAALQQQHGRFPRAQGSKELSVVEEEVELGRWCGRQRQRRKGNIGVVPRCRPSRCWP